jgi:hypothetical protein
VITLAMLQRRMAAAVMQPLATSGRMSRTAASGIAMRKEAAEFIKPNARLTSVERLEIYSRSYWFRLLDAFADDFPGLRAVVGQVAFNRLSRAYLADCPSRSFTLRNLGARLEEWLRTNQRYGGRAPGLALDMARLEWAHIEAFDGAAERAVGPEDLVHLNSGFRARLQPYITLLDVDHPVDEIRIQVNREIEERENTAMVCASQDGRVRVRRVSTLRLRPAFPSRIFLAVHRLNDTVYYRRLSPEEYLVLNAIRSGRRLGGAIEEGFRQSCAALDDRPAMVGSWFAAWAELGWLCAPSMVKKERVSE